MKMLITLPRIWLTAVLTMTLLAGCGKWDSSTEPGTETPVAPTTTNATPGNEADDVAVTSAPSVTFNKAMDETTINDTTFTLTGPGNTDVEGDVSYTPANRTATFVPTNNLEFATTYSATVTTGVRDDTGEHLASELLWTFTTEQDVFVTSTNPLEGGEVCTDRSIRAAFSKPLEPSSIISPALTFTVTDTLNPSAIEGEVSLDANGTTATFRPDVEFNPGAEYTATISTDVEDLNGNSPEDDVVWTFITNDASCQQTVTLGATEPYGVLSNTGITLGGGPDSTTGLRVDGDLGIFPAGACNGCDGTTVSGVIEIGTTAAEDAIDALEAAYDEATNLATNVCTLIDSGVLTTNPSASCGGGADGVFAPGLYWSSTSIEIPAGGTITLDAGNDSDAVFIFQSESTIDTVGGDTHVILQNGAQAKNVFWVAQSSATIGGTNSEFSGTILALIGITVNTGTNMVGRALARGAEVVVQDGALITVPTE